MKTAFAIMAPAFLLSVVSTCSAAEKPADKKKAPDVQALHDGVLVAAAEKAIFISRAEGGIEAIDLATGKPLWHTKKEVGQRWPVAVHGRTLVVRARDNPLRIASLDLDAKGKMLWISEPVLPAWVKGPDWLEDKPGYRRRIPASVLEDQSVKPNRKKELELEFLKAALARPGGTYRCEERIEKGEFVMRWQATGDLLENTKKEASGIVFVDLETGKVRTQPLEKDRKVEESSPPGTVEANGVVLSVAMGKHVGNWVKTYPPSRTISEFRTLRAVDKKTDKLLWEHTLWLWAYRETRRVNGG